MISNPALWKIVGSYFSTAITGTYQTFPVAGNFLFLFSYLFLIKAGTKHLHGFLSVAQL